jgi:hypothetical protein
MIALSDNQFAALMTVAGELRAEKRGVFLERVVARLSLVVRFTASEFDDAVRLAMHGLIRDGVPAVGLRRDAIVPARSLLSKLIAP